MNQEHGERVYTIISEGLLKIFSNTDKRMGLIVARLNTLMNKGETTQRTIQSLEVRSFGVFSDESGIVGVVLISGG